MKRHATRVADLLNPAAVLLPAANVIMQLSLPGVGYGVLESPVDSGNVYKHPFKRARTTGTYLAVATIGTESDRELIRAAVDTAHRQVRSTPSSPVSYNAFDPGAAAVGGRLPVSLFRRPARVSCTARSTRPPRMRSIRTPSDWAPPFKCAKGCGHRTASRSTTTGSGRWKTCASIPPVREHLHGVATMAFLPWPLHALAGPFNLFATTGFLAPEFRAMMRLEWVESQQRRFEWLLAALRLADRLIPHQAWISRLPALPVGHAVSCPHAAGESFNG